MDLRLAEALATDLRPASRLTRDLPMTYVTVPDKTAGDVFTEAMWDTYLRDNLNIGVDRAIADQALGSAASSIDFTSIPGTFAHLLVVLHARSDTAANQQLVSLRMNNDSGTNYSVWGVRSTDAAITTTGGAAATSAACGVIPAASMGAGMFGTTVLLLSNYAAAVNVKPFVALSGAYFTTGDMFKTLGGYWFSGNAINRLTFLPAANNFVAASRATIYGLGAV
jgi:hypothetical protein